MITPQLLREWAACWTDERIAKHYGTRMVLTPREIAEDAKISRDDRLWVLCKTLWHLDESAARKFAIDSAALVSHLAGREQDQVEHARLVADLRRIYAIPAGAERERELQRWGAAWGAAMGAARGAAREAAREAAWGAAMGAAWEAAREAAWGAAREAAWEAAMGAAWEAARGAAWRAAREAAWGAEMDKAIQRALASVEAVLAGSRDAA